MSNRRDLEKRKGVLLDKYHNKPNLRDAEIEKAKHSHTKAAVEDDLRLKYVAMNSLNVWIFDGILPDWKYSYYKASEMIRNSHYHMIKVS
jgi:hypothetical protein